MIKKFNVEIYISDAFSDINKLHVSAELEHLASGNGCSYPHLRSKCSIFYMDHQLGRKVNFREYLPNDGKILPGTKGRTLLHKALCRLRGTFDPSTQITLFHRILENITVYCLSNWRFVILYRAPTYAIWVYMLFGATHFVQDIFIFVNQYDNN